MKKTKPNSLLPTPSWTSYYTFSAPLKTLLRNNPADNEHCDSLILQLTITTALHLNQFTTIGLNQTLNRFIAQKAIRFSINHYDHPVNRYMEDSPEGNELDIKPQLTEKFFFKSEYIFCLDSTNKKSPYYRSRIN